MTLAFGDYSIAEFNGIKIIKNDKNLTLPAFELTFITENIETDFKVTVDMATIVKQPKAKPRSK